MSPRFSVPDRLLEAAFHSALYRVHMPQGRLDLRVGDQAAARRLRRRLNSLARSDLWIVTACNPGGRRAAPWTNARRRLQLKRWLDRRRLPWWPAVNIDPSGEWPDEAASCVEADARLALALGRRLDQAALLWIPARGAPELVWLQR